MIEYPSHFGLEFDPFQKNAKMIFVNTGDSKEARHRLNTFAETKGIGLLVGEPGKGKTTVTREWANGLNPSLYKVIYSSLSTLTVMEFYRNLASGLGAQPAYRKVDNFQRIQEEINRLWLAKRITPVIIMDEADSFNYAILNDLKILFNFDMDSQDRAAVLLTGLPQIKHTLKLTAYEPLRQRIVMKYEMEGLSKAEGRTYISEKLRGAGAALPIFEENAVEAVLNKANGIPRVINALCSSSLLIADSLSEKFVSLDTVMKAIDDTSLD